MRVPLRTIHDIGIFTPDLRAKSIEWISDSWDLDVEIIAKLVRSGIVPLEVPVEYHARTGNEGKKMRMVDAFTVVGAMIRFRVGR